MLPKDKKYPGDALWERNKASSRKAATARRISDRIGVMLKGAKGRAKKKGIEFTLTRTDICIPKICPVLGIPLTFSTGYGHAGSPTIDRFDSALGYIPSNISIISHRANTLKNNGNLEEFERLVAWLKRQS